MEHYEWGKRGLFPDIKHLAQVAVRQLTTQQLATHGNHFTHPLDEPTVQMPINEINAHLWGNTFDMRTGPEFYDRQGFPIHADDIELWRSMGERPKGSPPPSSDWWVG